MSMSWGKGLWSLIYTQNLEECSADAPQREWMLVEWPAPPVFLSNFTLNSIPPYFHLLVFSKHAKLKPGLRYSHDTPLLRILSNLGMSSSFHYSCFSSNVITLARSFLITLSKIDRSILLSLSYYLILLSLLYLLYCSCVCLSPPTRI